jgi:hypothetical protein
MKTPLFFDLTATVAHGSVHFRESSEVERSLDELRKHDVAVLEINGADLASEEDLFKAFAIALRMPKGWYGDEEYATNPNAFLEYLGDVAEWIPAKGHVMLIRGSEQLWRTAPRLAGMLIELWQFATLMRRATIHRGFVWCEESWR